MKMKFVEKISKSDVRSECIENEWFTAGTEEEYKKMFLLADIYPVRKAIALMSASIWVNSSEAIKQEEEQYHIASVLFNTCVFRYVEEDD